MFFQIEERSLPLGTLIHYRYHLVGEVVRVKSHSLTLVYLQASGPTVDRTFSDVFGKTSQAVLKKFPSLETVSAMPFGDLVEWLDVKGKQRFADPEGNARRLQRIAQDSYQLPEGWLTAVTTALTLGLRNT